MFCRVIQWIIEKDIDDYRQVKNTFAKKHLEKCPACRSRYEALLSLGERLSESEPIISAEQSSRLNEVMVRYRNNADGKVPASGALIRLSSVRKVITSAAAVFLIAFGVMYLLPEKETAFDNSGESGFGVDSIVQMFTEQNIESVPSLVFSPELMVESELIELQSQVESTFQFVQNCLPQEFLVTKTAMEESL